MADYISDSEGVYEDVLGQGGKTMRIYSGCIKIPLSHLLRSSKMELVLARKKRPSTIVVQRFTSKCYKIAPQFTARVLRLRARSKIANLTVEGA